MKKNYYLFFSFQEGVDHVIFDNYDEAKKYQVRNGLRGTVHRVTRAIAGSGPIDLKEGKRERSKTA